ncbi:MAG: ATP-binding cassette domain-containing protein, partial [Oscillospiraceae bacterium]
MSVATEVMISAQGIHKSFGSVSVLRGVSLELARGEVVAIIGPSGSGKSTFLRCLNHLETIDRGTIVIEGEVLARSEGEAKAQYVGDAEIRKIGRKMGMVFQSFNLFPHLTVLENIIEAPVIVKGLTREQIIPKAEALLAKVGLAAKRD